MNWNCFVCDKILNIIIKVLKKIKKTMHFEIETKTKTNNKCCQLIFWDVGVYSNAIFSRMDEVTQIFQKCLNKKVIVLCTYIINDITAKFCVNPLYYFVFHYIPLNLAVYVNLYVYLCVYKWICFYFIFTVYALLVSFCFNFIFFFEKHLEHKVCCIR